MPEPLCITKHQQAAKRRFEALIAKTDAADAAYNVLPESCGGKIISTDITRLLDDSYRNPPAMSLRDLAPSWEGAWRYAQGRLFREIKERGVRKRLRLMSGGWASGKTFALQHAAAADLAWDGTLTDATWASGIIEHAIHSRWKIEVAYVQRPIDLALWGALDRAAEEGRAVPLLELPLVHQRSQRSVLELHSWYSQHADVSFTLLFNAGSRGNRVAVVEMDISLIAPGGRLHYTDADVKSYQQTARQVWQAAKQSGHYPAEILAAAGAGMG